MKQNLFAVGAMSLIAAAAVVACGGGSSTNVSAPPQAPFTAKIIGFNDFHGNLESPGTFSENTGVPAASRPAVGGAAAVAGYVAALKRQNPLNVVVGAGDFIGATPLISSLFFDEPAIEALNRIGMEFNAVGNHEFDQGSAELVRLSRRYPSLCLSKGCESTCRFCLVALTFAILKHRPITIDHQRWIAIRALAACDFATRPPGPTFEHFGQRQVSWCLA